MKEESFILKLDKAERGVLILALNDFRNKRIEEEKTIDTVNDVLEEIIQAPTKKVKIRP
jgi:hypothetical protein